MFLALVNHSQVAITYRISVLGTGSAKLPFECQDFEPMVDSTGATGVTTFCSVADGIPVPGKPVSQKSLPPYSLTDPLPPVDSCTVYSIVAPAWRFSGFETTNNATSSSDSIQFDVELQTSSQSNDTDTATVVSKSDVHLASPSWYQCDLAGGLYGSGPSNCTLRYDAASRLVTLNAEWSCSDLDAAHPYVYHHTVTR